MASKQPEVEGAFPPPAWGGLLCAGKSGVGMPSSGLGGPVLPKAPECVMNFTEVVFN
jgi:hypothetical protein